MDEAGQIPALGQASTYRNIPAHVYDDQGASMISKITSLIQTSWNSTSASGSIFRNMATLASGAVMVRIITVASMPVITRIYLPEHMGVLSLFSALSAMLVPLGTLRYSSAIPLPKRDGIALNLAVLCAVTLLSVTAIIALVFAIVAPNLLRTLSMEQLLPYWWLLPLAILGAGLYDILQNWAVRTKSFRIITETQVSQAIIGSSVKIGLGALGLKPLGLLIGEIFLQAGGILSFSRNFWPTFSHNRRWLTAGHLQFVAFRYSDFPKYRFPSQFLLILATKAPLFYYAWQFGPDTAGQLGLALGMLALPMTLFGQSTGQAYYAEIARIGNKQPEKIYQITRIITKKLFIASIAPFVVILTASPLLFSIVFGGNWKTAGNFAAILSFYLLAQFISSPLVNVLTVFDKQHLFLFINISRVCGIMSLFAIAHFFQLDPLNTLCFYSGFQTLFYIFLSVIVFSVVTSHRRIN